MKWLGTRAVELDTIKLPGGFAKRKKAPHVAELAISIAATGVISLPVVRASDRKLVAGGDRIAALMLAGIDPVEVRLVEGTDAELEMVTIQENLCRRRGDDYDAMTARLVELAAGKVAIGVSPAGSLPFAPGVETEIQANLAENSPRPVGRPKTAKGIAREEVARATGRTPEAVRQSEKRAAAQEVVEVAPDAPMPAPVDTFDLELSDAVVRDWFPRVRVVQEVLRDSQRKLDGVLRRLTSDLKTGSNIATAAYARTYQAVHDAAFVVRSAMPESVCPWCKAQLHLTPACSGCGETGFVASSVLEGISPELLERGDHAKVPDGRGGFRQILQGTLGLPKPAKPAKAKPQIRVEDKDGNTLWPAEPAPASPLVVEAEEETIF